MSEQKVQVSASCYNGNHQECKDELTCICGCHKQNASLPEVEKEVSEIVGDGDILKN